MTYVIEVPVKQVNGAKLRRCQTFISLLIMYVSLLLYVKIT